MKNTYLEKRSMNIAGKCTSLALEPEFWSRLEKRARQIGTTLPKLAADIGDNPNRPKGQSLASAMRCSVLP